MRIDILTLFPQMFPGYLDESILKRAQTADLLEIKLHNIRDFAEGKHRVTDEPPYGGGGGMLLKPEPIFAAVESLISNPSASSGQVLQPLDNQRLESPPVILLTPQGRPFSQKVAQELAQHERMLLICGRYEGVDERVRQHLVTDEISIGDFVLTGGELAAMVVVDAVARLLPGVLGAEAAAGEDSYATGLLEGPHYTRPETFRNWAVPEVLRSGHAANIQRWRREQALRRTWQRRPDLLLTAVLSQEDRWFLGKLAGETSGQ
ncbi:tRNA (guanine(37)-N(1))-methyltransferase [hydrothermal vent metagenome]|uniref:tRNA (guanine-N(1)-)-methyltransferase n=1 Tax=hydrothermal vent metagenome TaxID=652676 RepID=A0A3B0VJN7_9ZZZZ